MDLPADLLGVVTQKTDWKTLCVLRSTCSELCAVCDVHAEGRRCAWFADPANDLEKHLKKACAQGGAVHARLILKTLRSRLTEDERVVLAQMQASRAFDAVRYMCGDGPARLSHTLDTLLFETVERRGKASIVTALLDAGACPQGRRGVRVLTTPLHMAYARGLDDVVAALEAAGADPAATDGHGMTPAGVVRMMRAIRLPLT